MTESKDTGTPTEWTDTPRELSAAEMKLAAGGGSVSPARKGQIEVESFSWGCSNPGAH